MNNLEDDVRKEERLAKKKLLELKWKEMIAHNLRKRWAKEWLEEIIENEIVPIGRKKVEGRMIQLVLEMADQSTIIGAGNESRRKDKERNDKLELASNKRERLLLYLDRWWTTLEGGIPDLEKEMELSPSQKGGKRKKEPNENEINRKRQATEEVAEAYLTLSWALILI